jgi:hypothetical protein
MPNRNMIEAQFIMRGFNNTKVAKILNIARSTLIRKMNGESDFTVKEIKAISENVGIPVSFFFDNKVA